MTPPHKKHRQFLLLILLCLAYAGSTGAQAPDKSAIPFSIAVERIHNAIQGSVISVEISKTAGSEEMHGFDFLIGYDTAALTLVGAGGGEIFRNPGAYEWEHFEYHSEIMPVACDSDWCPTGLIRAVGVADINNGAHQPLQLNLADGTDMVRFDFEVTTDSTYDCMWIPIRFFWIDCGDNGIAMEMNATIGLALSNEVIIAWDYYPDISDPDYGFPGIYGAPDSCIMDSSGTARFINFYNGGVDVECSDYIQINGDVNVNGVPYEIADWVMFSNYFITGLVAFGSHAEASIAASDANFDGTTLQFEDITYLARVARGEFSPYTDYFEHDQAISGFLQDLGTSTISLDYPDSLVGAYFMFQGEIVPELLVDTALNSISYFSSGSVTEVFIQPNVWPWPPSDPSGFFAGPLFTYSGFGVLIEAHAANAEDNIFVENRITVLPAQEARMEITPDTILASWARISDTGTVTIYVGEFAGHLADEVDVASIRVNDSIIPDQVTLLPTYPEFAGQVLEIVVSLRDFVLSYGRLNIDANMPFTAKGEFNDHIPFTAWREWTAIAQSATIPIPEGWPTIQSALDIAVDGDTILVADGVYSGEGNRDITLGENVHPYSHDDRFLVLRSENGPEATIIDCGGSESEPHRALKMSLYVSEKYKIIDGFTFRGGYHDSGGAIFISAHIDDTIRNCIFIENEAVRGGAVFAKDEWGLAYGSTTIDNCFFINNSAMWGGGAFFDLNNTFDPEYHMATVDHCTFYGNSCASTGASIYARDKSPIIKNSLFAFGLGGATYVVRDPSPIVQCTNIYGYTGLEWGGSLTYLLGVNGNISLDPLFCDTIAGDYRLHGTSPCIPSNNSCGILIGAYDLGCGIRCGDINDNGMVEISDAVFMIAYLFRGGPPPPVIPASDLNANGELDIGDAVVIINFVFKAGPPPDCVTK